MVFLMGVNSENARVNYKIMRDKIGKYWIKDLDG